MSIPGKHNKGFTLVEMLIVVAIIAVLVIVAIPIYNAQLEKTRAQVCLNNREVLRRQLYADLLLYDDGVEIITMAEQHMEDEDIICPSGGIISAWGDAKKFAVVCDYHIDSPLYNLANLLKEYGIGDMRWNHAIDSNGEGEFITAITAILNENKYNLGGNAIKSWIAVRQGNNSSRPFSLYWSAIGLPARGTEEGLATFTNINTPSELTVDSQGNPVGGIPTIKYDDNTGLYSVGYVTLKEKDTNNNVQIYAYSPDYGNANLNNQGFTPIAESSDVNELRQTYNELLDAYNEKMEALSQQQQP